MTKYAIIVAAGRGLRMGAPIPKQFLRLLNKPVLLYSVQTFLETFPDIEIILVLPDEIPEDLTAMIQELSRKHKVNRVTGGETRFHSVRNGLDTIKKPGIVFVHDGARPLVSQKLLLRCYEQALQKGSAIPAIPVTDSIRQINGNDSLPVSRDYLRIIQTPQTFRTELICPAFQCEYRPEFTDEATVAEAAGIKIWLVEGEKRNLKITTPDDMKVAEAMLAI